MCWHKKRITFVVIEDMEVLSSYPKLIFLNSKDWGLFSLFLFQGQEDGKFSRCERKSVWGKSVLGNMTIEDSLKDKRRNQFIMYAVSGEF